MFFGVEIQSGLLDWQVLQRRDGVANVALSGRWQLEPGAIRAGVSSATPVARVVNELDQTVILPGTPCDRQTGGDVLTGAEVKGEWSLTLPLPQGGPYRLETSLDAVSAANGDHWMFRGDVRVHVGVGDVFCMAGQSNAAGYAKGVAFDPPDPRVHLLRNRGRWDMAAHPMNEATEAADCVNAPMSVTGTSPFLSFGRRYADLTGLPVGLIQCAQGGSPMDRWDSAKGGDLYLNMLSKTRDCADVRAILWYQGCADTDARNAAVYGQRFARLVADTRRAAGWDVPFFTVQLNKYESQPDAAAWGRIKELQRRAAREIDGVWLMPTAGLPLSDEIHNSAAGNVTLGEWLARQVHGALNGGAPCEAPDIERARMDGGKVRLSFRNATELHRLRTLHDVKDFILTDARGEIAVAEIAVRGGELLLTPERPPEGATFVSYGTHPFAPEGPIVDLRTWLPIISFDHVEVEQ